MPKAFLTLIFDAQLENGVRRYWQLLAAAGLTIQNDQKHRPHITLAGFDLADPQTCGEPLRQFALRFRPLPIRLHHIGVFPERSVLFLQPQATRSLFALQQSVMEELGPVLGNSPTSSNFAIDNWTPHCTLIESAPHELMDKAVRTLIEHWSVLEGRAIGIGVLVPPATDDCPQSHFGDPTGAGRLGQ